MSPTGAPPEEAIVDAVLSDPLGAEILLTALANSPGLMLRHVLVADLSRKHDLTSDRVQTLLAALHATGVIRSGPSECELLVAPADALRYATVLRGVAFAQHRQRDANSVDITLSPPASPSRLMETLPKAGFSWARLFDTKDSLIELAGRAQRRFVIVSPFLDDEGLRWIGALFEAARGARERLLIVRGRDETELSMLRSDAEVLAGWNARILTYAVAHDPAVRSPVIETFHAKILVSDNNGAYIGSANMTRWSRDVSMECGVIVTGPCVRPVATLVDAIISIAEPLRLSPPPQSDVLFP
jgi:phosphatidylserine/phosphatidylglycerophosphate/cardiolipin synthase-like enzyme